MNELIFQLGLDIGQAKQAATNLQSLIDDIERNAKDAIKIGVDSGGVKGQLDELKGAINDIVGKQEIDVTVNTSAAKQAADEIKTILNDALAGDGIKSFAQAQKDTDQLLGSQKQALAALVLAGQEGSSEYQKLLADTAKLSSESKGFSDALSQVEQALAGLGKSNPIDDLALSFGESQKAVTDSVSVQKQALAALVLAGKEGSDEYQALLADTVKLSGESKNFSDALAKVDGALSGFGKSADVIGDLARSFTDSQQSAQSATTTQKQALAALALAGQTGSEQYQKLLADTKNVGDEQQKLDTALKQVEKDLENLGGDSISRLAKGFTEAQQAASAAAASQKQALAALALQGQTGSSEYQTMLADVKRATDEQLKFDNAVKQVEKDLSDLNADPISKLAKAFADSQQSANASASAQKQALASLAAQGKTGSEEYKKLLIETKKATDEQQRLDEAVKKVDEDLGLIGKQKNPFGAFFQFNQITQGIQTLSSAIGELSSPFKALDTATASLRTLGDEAAAMAPNLREAAIQMSKDLPFAAADLQQTMFDALASGVKGGEDGLKSFADTAAKLAVGGGSEIGAATNVLAGNLNAYGKSAEEAAKFSDIFFNTVNYGVTSIPELSSTLANVIPTASGLGIELENVGAALAVMTSKGVPTAQSTTKLNALFIELAKPGAALAKVLKEAGVSLESLKQDDLPVTLGKVKTALEQTGKAAVQVFSSSEAGAAFQVLAGDLEGFQQTFADVRDTAGSAQNAYMQMADSIEVSTNQMQARIEAFVIEGMDMLGNSVVGVIDIAGQLAPTFATFASLGALLPQETFESFKKKAVDSLTSVKDLATGVFFDIAEDGTKSFKGFANSIGGVGKNVKDVLLKALAAIIPGLLTVDAATGVTTVSFTAMWTAVTGPVGIAIAGFAAVAAALTYFFTQTETGKEVFEDIMNYAKAAFDFIASYVSSFASAVGKLFSGDIIGASKELASAFGDAASAAADSITDSELSDAIDSMKERLTDAASVKLKIDTAEAVPALTKQLQDVQSKISDIEVKVNTGTATDDEIAQLDSLKKKASEVSEQIQKIAPEAVESIKTVTTSTGETFTVYDIGAEKAKKFADEQKRIFGSEFEQDQQKYTQKLNESFALYGQQQQRLEQLKAEFNKAVESGDTDTAKDLQEKIKEFTEKVNTSREEIGKAIQEGGDKGLIIPADVKVPPQAVDAFQGQIDAMAEAAKKKLREKQLGDAVSLVVEIEAKIKENDALPKLVEQYKNAATDVEKQNIAKIIQKTAPDAVKAIGEVLDAEGNLVPVLEVNTEKVLENAEANKERFSADLEKARAKYVDGIKQEGAAFQDSSRRVKELQAAIAREPGNSGLKKELQAVRAETTAAATQAGKYGAQLIKAGGSAEDAYAKVAAATGRSREEAKALVDKQMELIGATEKAAAAQRDYAAAWAATGSAASAALSQATATLNQISDDAAEVRKGNQSVINDIINGAAAGIGQELTDAIKEQFKNVPNELERQKKIALAILAETGRQAREQRDKNDKLINQRARTNEKNDLGEVRRSAIQNSQTRLKATTDELEKEKEARSRSARQRITDETELAVELIEIERDIQKKKYEAQIRQRDTEFSISSITLSDAAKKTFQQETKKLRDDLDKINIGESTFDDRIIDVYKKAFDKLFSATQKGSEDLVKDTVDTLKSQLDALSGKDAETLKQRQELSLKIFDEEQQLRLFGIEQGSEKEKAILEKSQADRAALILKTDAEIAVARERERIAAIANDAEREKELRVLAAKEVLDKELADAGKSTAIRYEAFVKFHRERMAAEDEFAKKTQIGAETLRTTLTALSKSLVDAFGSITFDVDTAAADDAKTQIAAIAEEQKKLAEEQKKGSKTFQEVQSELEKLYDRQQEAQKKLRDATPDIWGGFASATAKAFASVTDALKSETTKQLSILDTLAEKQKADIAAKAELEAKEAQLRQEGRDTEADAVKEQADAIGKALANSSTQSAAAIDAIFKGTLATAITSFGQLAFEGENIGKAFLKSALDLLRSMVPIWSAQILGGSLATPASILSGGAAGIIEWAALTALIEGAVAAAGAAIGFRKGGYTGDGNPDAEAGVVHKREFVHTAETTARHRDLFEHIHKGGDPLEYLLKTSMKNGGSLASGKGFGEILTAKEFLRQMPIAPILQSVTATDIAKSLPNDVLREVVAGEMAKHASIREVVADALPAATHADAASGLLYRYTTNNYYRERDARSERIERVIQNQAGRKLDRYLEIARRERESVGKTDPAMTATLREVSTKLDRINEALGGTRNRHSYSIGARLDKIRESAADQIDELAKKIAAQNTRNGNNRRGGL